jgi:HNH endonuclease
MKKYDLKLFDNAKVLERFKINLGHNPFVCWKSNLWHARGYAQFSIRGRSYYAHRLSWMLFNNKNWPTKLESRHICNNTWCLNPRHIVPGTRQQNANDRNYFGNQIRGDKSPRIKLSEANGLELKQQWLALPNKRGIKGQWKKEQAKKLQVSESLIGKIVSGQLRKYYKEI